MKLSFVIPAYNEEKFVGECLETILAQKRALEEQKKVPPGSIEIIAVNNASTDGTEAAIKKYPEVKLVNEPAKGIVRARRAGFLAATGDLIANVDSDTRLSPGWIATVFKEFEKDPKLVALSGPFIYYDLSSIVRFFTKIHYAIGYGAAKLLRTGAMLQGGNFIVRRDALLKIGGYDTSIEFYGEDTDIARRMNKIGKVKFTFRLPMYSSGRRLAKEGGLTTGVRYAVNYFWITLFGKPFTKDHSDIRVQEKNIDSVANRLKESALGILVILVMLFILAVLVGAAYEIYIVIKVGIGFTIR